MSRRERKESSLGGQTFGRILIIRLSAIGDVVRTMPCLAVLRRNFPSAKITWLVEEKSRDLLDGQPELDELIVFPRTVWVAGLARGRWWAVGKEVVGFVRRLRQERFDLIIDFHGILKSGLISMMSGAGVRVGFEKGFCKEWNYLFNNWRVSLPRERLSRFERNLRLLEGVGLGTEDCRIRLSVSNEDRRYAHDFLQRNGLLGQSPLVALHPGTSERTHYKRWFPEAYARVADGLVEKLGASIIVTWGPGERETAEKVVSLMKSPGILSCLTRSLKQLASIYANCQLYVGADTGPMHVASLMGVPVVGIYGPTDPVVNAPYPDTPFIQVRKDVACNPCRNLSCERLDCLKAISHEEVLNAAVSLLRRVESGQRKGAIG